MTTHGHAHKHFGAEDNVKSKGLQASSTPVERARRASYHLAGGRPQGSPLHVYIYRCYCR